jgi:LysR family glycine cleavage system transcriptional activator
MGRMLPPFAAIRAFDAVAHHGGIRRAATALDRDHAAVSRQLRALEDWLGAALFDRSTGLLTPDGLQYQKRIGRALDEIDGASREIAGRSGDGLVLKVWCAPGFASRWLSVRLKAFEALHPEIDVELRPADRRPDLIRNEADTDIRYVVDGAGGPPAGIRMAEIARPFVMPVASPDYLASAPKVGAIEDLLNLRLLHEEDYSEWSAWFGAQGLDAADRVSGPRLWHAHLTIDAAIRGEGVALGNSFLIADELKQGRLKLVTPEAAQVAFGAYVFMARDERWRNRGLMRFREWLTNASVPEPL